MKSHPSRFLCSFSLIILFTNILVTCEEVQDDKTNATTLSPLLHSIDNIINKVKWMKDTIGKSRHENLLAEGYTFTRDIGYHKLFKTKLSWRSALQHCQSENAHLAVIDSTAEREAVGRMLRESLDSEATVESINAYVGVHDYCKNGSWVTIFFDVLDNAKHLKWKQEPSDTVSSKGPNCAAINEEGYLSGLTCSTPLAFICEQGQ